MKNFTILLLTLMLSPFMGVAQWTQVGDSLNPEPEYQLNKGYALALSDDGSTVIIGAPVNDVAGVEETQSYAQVMRFELGNWIQVGDLILGGQPYSSGTPPSAGKGVAISADGNLVAVGEPYYKTVIDDELTPAVGRVRVFELIEEQWQQVGDDIFDVPNFEGDITFGSTVSLSADGSILAVGARIGAGQVRVYENIEGSWVPLGSPFIGVEDNENLGYNIDLSADGSVMVMSAPHNDETFQDGGRAMVYKYESGDWQLTGSFLPEGPYAEIGYGLALSDDGAILAISEPQYHDGSATRGRVKIYQWIDGAWETTGELLGESAFRLGRSIDLSADGTLLAAGTNGWGDGSVRFYQYASDEWEILGEPLVGAGSFGTSVGGKNVSLSADGSVVAIGAPMTAIEGLFASGTALVYQNCELANIMLDMLEPEAFCAGGSTSIEASINPEYYSNGLVYWYDSEESELSIAEGLTFETPVLEESTSFWVQSQTPVGCPSALVEVDVEVLPIPEAPQAESIQYFFEGATIEDLEVSGTGTIIWYTDEALTIEITTSTVLIDGNTYYCTEIVDGCESESTAITVNMDTSSIDEFGISGFSFYPNPVVNELILFSEEEIIQSVVLMDMTGKVLIDTSQENTGSNRLTLDMGSFHQGVYLVEVKTGISMGIYRVLKM